MIETIESFFDRHGACDDDKKWALENCSTMLDVWERAKQRLLIWVATRPGVLDRNTLCLFVHWCFRQAWHLMDDEMRRTAVLVAEKFASGDAMEDEFFAAKAAELSASWAAAREAWVAGRASWSDYEAARNAAREAQAKWLRENAKPNFEVVLKKLEDAK